MPSEQLLWGNKQKSFFFFSFLRHACFDIKGCLPEPLKEMWRGIGRSLIESVSQWWKCNWMRKLRRSSVSLRKYEVKSWDLYLSVLKYEGRYMVLYQSLSDKNVMGFTDLNVSVSVWKCEGSYGFLHLWWKFEEKKGFCIWWKLWQKISLQQKMWKDTYSDTGFCQYLAVTDGHVTGNTLLYLMQKWRDWDTGFYI